MGTPKLGDLGLGVQLFPLVGILDTCKAGVRIEFDINSVERTRLNFSFSKVFGCMLGRLLAPVGERVAKRIPELLSTSYFVGMLDFFYLACSIVPQILRW